MMIRSGSGNGRGKGEGGSWFHDTPKPFINGLSPGCRSCIEGKWSCLYINGLCTRDCSFCPQDKISGKERLPVADDITFSSSDEYISYLRKFDFEGIGFSGGEPFLVFDLLLEHIRKIRKNFGSRHHIWVYTNGDLVTAHRLELLKKAGLDEIRFDISARGYDLAPVELAAKHIGTVTIEVPALADGVMFIKKNLKRFEEIGVKYLNLHQIIINKSNHARMVGEGKTDSEAIKSVTLGSEQAAFEIMDHAIRIKSNLGINYCSSRFKDQFQAQATRRRYAPFVRKGLDKITPTGFIRRLSAITAKHLAKPAGTAPSTGIGRIDYFRPVISMIPKEEPSEKIHERTPVTVKIRNTRFVVDLLPAGSFDLANESSALFFHKLFVEGKKPGKVASEIMRHFGLGPGVKDDLLDDINEFYSRFRNLEYLEVPAHDCSALLRS